MDLRDLDLNLLVVFNQLLIDRRVSTAAESLGLTQPTVSNALRRLRTALQDDLFVRTYQGMEPTPYAQQLAEPVSLAIHTLREALSRQDSFDPLTSERTFTIAMTDIGEIYFTPRLMDALSRLAPGCRISTVRFAECCVQPFGLVALPHPVQLPEIDINLFWHAKYHRDSANRWLRQLMFELFAD